MSCSTRIHSTPDLVVSRFEHPAGIAHVDPEAEVATGWGIAFLRSGSFRVEISGRQRRLVPGSVFLTAPGLQYRCQHDHLYPEDVCLAIDYLDTAIGEAGMGWTIGGAHILVQPTARLSFAGQRLAHAATNADSFEIERWALASFTALCAETTQPRRRGPYAPRRTDLEIVLLACRAIEANPAAKRSIGERAREFDCSAVRLTHLFRRYLGISPHRYVVRHRLALAADLLTSGTSVTETCYRVGFDNLSHFVRRFRHHLGVRASEWRALAPREKRRKVQAMLHSAP